MLIDVGAELDRADEYGNTPLFIAITSGNNEMAKLLIDAGADVNKGGDYRETGFRREFKGVTPPIVQAVTMQNPEWYNS